MLNSNLWKIFQESTPLEHTFELGILIEIFTVASSFNFIIIINNKKYNFFGRNNLEKNNKKYYFLGTK